MTLNQLTADFDDYVDEFQDTNYNESMWGFSLPTFVKTTSNDNDKKEFMQLKLRADDSEDAETLFEVGSYYEQGLKYCYVVNSSNTGKGTESSDEWAYHYYYLSSQRGLERGAEKLQEFKERYDTEQIAEWETKYDEKILELPEPNLVQNDIHSQLVQKVQQDMKEEWIPYESTIRTNIFLSKDSILKTANKLILIIQGNNTRAGLWQLKEGQESTMLPLIKESTQSGYAIAVLNPNVNKGRATENSNWENIKGNESPLKHVTYVWTNIISKLTSINKIFIVASGSGGSTVLSLLQSKATELLPKLKGIAFIDSSHRIAGHGLGVNGKAQLYQFIERNCVHYKKSNKPYGTVLPSIEGSPCYSHGNPDNLFVSHQLIKDIINFFDKK